LPEGFKKLAKKYNRSEIFFQDGAVQHVQQIEGPTLVVSYLQIQ